MKQTVIRYYHALRNSDNHWLRKCVGVLLVIGGLLGFLPVLGFWMLPLGLALLAVDWPFARRLSHWLTVRGHRLRDRFRLQSPQAGADRNNADTPYKDNDP